MGLAPVEEGAIGATAAAFRQQDGFSTVEHPLRIVSGGGDRCREIGMFMRQGQTGRGADHGVALISGYQNGAVRGGEGGKISGLVVRRALVQIGPVAEYPDAQMCQSVDRRRDPGPTGHGFQAQCRLGHPAPLATAAAIPVVRVRVNRRLALGGRYSASFFR